MIDRPELVGTVRRALRESPVAVLAGPRQCGKTTLAGVVAGGSAEVFDLENPVDMARLEAPLLALEPLRGLVVIDEVQRKPDLFGILRVLADRKPAPARFLLLGSASPHLVRGVSETLAGRVRFIEMGGFDLAETGPDMYDRLWLRGGFPLSFLASSEARSFSWREDFIRTFLERDIPQLGISIPAAALRRFWTMVSHFHGRVWNAAEFARSMGSSEPTARRYLDIISGAYIARQLVPWHENISKRQVKAPKVYIRDSGLLHSLLSIPTRRHLMGHPKVGASWEGFAIEQVLALVRPSEAYFWATHAGAELDLMVIRRGQRLGFEMKHADAPVLTKSMRIAQDTLKLRKLMVVYPGAKRYKLSRNADAVPLALLPDSLA